MADIVAQLPIKITDSSHTVAITTGSALQVDLGATTVNATAIKVDGSAATQPVSGTVTANAGSGTFTVVSSKSNNGAAPGSSNLGVLPALANASAPSWTEGNQVTLSTDLAGSLRVTGSSGGGVANLQVRNGSNAWTDIGYFGGDLNVPIQGTVSAGTGVFTVAPNVGAVVTGTITTSASTITYTVANAQGAWVSVHGTYAGVNFTFQGSDDAGTTFYPIIVARSDGSATESVTGVLTANTSRAWFVYFGAINQFQIAASAYASGTANIRITPLAEAQPMVSSGGGTSTIVQANAGTGTFTVTGTTTAIAGSGTFTVSISNTATVVANAGTGNFNVIGTKTNNNAAPGATNVGTLGALANAAAPSWTEGNLVVSSVDLSGNQRSIIQNSPTVVAGSGTFTVSVSNTPTVVANAGSGTFTVTGTVTANAGSGSFTVAAGAGTYTCVAVPYTSGSVQQYGTVSAVASGSTGTITYTTAAGPSVFYLSMLAASASGGPCKVQGLITGTVFCTSFFSTAIPYVEMNFPQPISVPATTVVSIVIQNNAGSSQDVYAEINGRQSP